MNRPIEVSRAVLLLWISLVIGIVSSTFALLDTGPGEDHVPLWFVLTTALAAFVISAIPIYFVARRHNWARIFVLVLFVLTTDSLFWPSSALADDWLSVAIDFFSTLIEIIALYWLFTGQGAAWFRHREPA